MAQSADAVAAKWQQRLSASTQEIIAGVQAVTQAPGAKAAAQADTWLLRLQASRDKWARNVAAVSLGSWQQAMINKGVPRVAQGAQASQPKMAAFMTQFLPHVESVAQQVRSMPKVTLEDGIARAAAQIRGNATFVRKPYNL